MQWARVKGPDGKLLGYRSELNRFFILKLSHTFCLFDSIYGKNKRVFVTELVTLRDCKAVAEVLDGGYEHALGIPDTSS